MGGVLPSGFILHSFYETNDVTKAKVAEMKLVWIFGCALNAFYHNIITYN